MMELVELRWVYLPGAFPKLQYRTRLGRNDSRGEFIEVTEEWSDWMNVPTTHRDPWDDV